MSWIDETIKDFGRGMGMEGLALNEQGMLCLSFETRGNLYLEKTENGLLLYLARDIPDHHPEILEKAFRLCHFREELPLDVHPGFGNPSSLVFLVRIDEPDFSLPRLEEGFNLLMEMHDKAAGRL